MEEFGEEKAVGKLLEGGDVVGEELEMVEPGKESLLQVLLSWLHSLRYYIESHSKPFSSRSSPI